MERRVRKLRLIQVMILAAIVTFAIVGEMTSNRGNSDWGMRQWIVAAAAILAAENGFYLRTRLLRKSRNALLFDARDEKGGRQWEVANVIGLAMAGTVAMWGLIDRLVFVGTRMQALPFYVAGVLLALMWTPRNPILVQAKSSRTGQ